MKIRKIMASMLCVGAVATLASCGKEPAKELSATEKIIQEAEGMTLQELCAKAITEGNGKTFYGVGNSSRGKNALPNFITYLKTLNADFTMNFEWQQPKENSIFEMLEADAKKDSGTFSMTLIQDGNQIQSKMVETGVLDTFIPKEWASANNTTADKYEGYLPLQTLNKVFMFNNTGSKTYKNCWDFVAQNEKGLFMDIDSEVVGKNFLYMLTQDKYANMLKEAYDQLDSTKKTYFDTTINGLADKATELKLGTNGKYALAWIKLWVEQYNAQTDDGPICNELVKNSSTDQFGLLVYSKLRSVAESDSASANNVTVAAYQDGYKGIGGYGYCHYLFVTDNSPLPWTACAFNAYMTVVNNDADKLATALSTTEKTVTVEAAKIAGFSAWGKDMGGYSSNPLLAAANEAVYKHKTAGGTEFPNKNDKGYDWWTTTGQLVLEDPGYCSSVAWTVGRWIQTVKATRK